jgi:prepilin-type processing-associated H-X9-DG protein
MLNDENNQLIPFSAFTFAQENGNDPNGSTYSNILFLDGSSSSSSVYLGSPGLNQASNPIVTLQSSIPISRLEYYIFMDDQGLNITSNSIRVNFATQVPEPTSSLALLAFGAAGVYRWRKGKENQDKD